MEYYVMYSSCVLVSGYNRDVIYDLQRGKMFYVPKELSPQLKIPQKIDDISGDLLIFSEFLEKEDILFKTKTPSYFPPLEVNTNAVDCVEIQSLVLLIEDVSKLKDLKPLVERLVIGYLRIDFTSDFDMKRSKEVNEFFDGLSSLRSEVLFYNLETSESKESLLNVFTNEINSMYLIDSSVDETTHINDDVGRYLFTINKNLLEDNRVPTIESFRINIEMFNEANVSNSFYNKRIYVTEDKEAYFDYTLQSKACSLVNFSKKEFLERIENSPFNIPKDKIEICKDCEYRYMCLDNRTISRNHSVYEYDSSCNYDPYTSTWK